MLRTSSIHVYDHFDLYLTPVTLTFNLPKSVSNGNSPSQGQQLCQIVLKSTHYCTSYGPDKSGQTHGRTHIHRTKNVTTMSRLSASGLDNKMIQLNKFYIYFVHKIFLYKAPKSEKGNSTTNRLQDLLKTNKVRPGRVAQSAGHLTRKSGVLGSIPGLATYFRFSFRFFKKGS